MDTLSKAFETSLSEAISKGRIDMKAQAAPIQAARILARLIDEDPEHSANVKFPTMLKYCEALGMLPDAPKPEEKPKANGLTVMVNRSKYSKQAANA